MPVTEHWAYLDHAAVAPLSGPARAALAEWADDVAGHGVVHEPRWLKRAEEIRRQFGRLLQADPLDVAFVKNTSEGIGLVAEGFPWQPGDNVVGTRLDHDANVSPWRIACERSGATHRLAPFDAAMCLAVSL